ncbi:DinB family protein [Aquirufa rosea]|uniref:DinB family protein n=1 Tax=Aquirufa rosea TaxID=2509241 RepID=A0A4Q1BZ68_9BACT|nr:DinB family protein [Aquirufa rosea]RXK48834.1 DinB family protein [Aquirufa rosea]
MKDIFKDLLAQNIHSCSFSFSLIDEENISKKLNNQASSVGFIYRHIGETMLLFGYFFDIPSEIQNTTMGQQDVGQGNDLLESRKLVEKGYKMMEEIIEITTDAGWSDIIDTPFFGAVSKAKLFAHILFHNAYHAGQIGLSIKRGN